MNTPKFSTLRKLKAGTWVELTWEDHVNSAALLIDDASMHEDTISLIFYHPEPALRWRCVGHKQIVRVIGAIQVPSIIDGTKAQ